MTSLANSGIAQYAQRVVGQPIAALRTPALLLDLDALRLNIAVMARQLTGTARLRPHAKVHKCREIAQMQLDAGAIGITTATVWEAVAFARAGAPEILIANEVVGPEKIAALADAARETRMLVAVDDCGNAEALSAAAGNAGSEIGVLVDIDTGMNRCGVRSTADARAVAECVHRLPGLRLRGVTGYEGHCSLETDRAVRKQKAGAAMDYLLEITASLAQAGLPMDIVSAGGTGTADMTGLDARVTEIQAGSYIFMDVTRLGLGLEYKTSLTVLATVVSRQGATAVLDCGRKTIGPEFNLPRVLDDSLTTRGVSEEHLLLDVPPDNPLAVGDQRQVLPGYAPTTVNLYALYHVVQHGMVVDVWPVLARGVGDV